MPISYPNKIAHLQQLRPEPGQDHAQCLEAALRLAPFSQQWSGQLDGRLWEQALRANPYSLQLWLSHLSWCKDNKTAQDHRQAIDRAIALCSHDVGAGQLLDYALQKDPIPGRAFQLFKIALTRPIHDLQAWEARFLGWFEGLGGDQLQAVWKAHRKEPLLDADRGRTIVKEEMANHRVRSAYLLEGRQELLIQVATNQKDEGGWLALLARLKQQVSSTDDIIYHYEKAINARSESMALWRNYIEYLQWEHPKGQALLLDRMRVLQPFIVAVNPQLGHVLAELQEKEGAVPRAREVYLAVEKEHVRLQTFQRHIYMQIRAKELPNAKALYDSALHIFACSQSIATHLALEFASFAKRELKDPDFGRKVLRTQFQATPLKADLLVGYLDFLAGLESKEGSRENKELGNEIMELAIRGLGRAKASLAEQEYERLLRVVQLKVRGFFPSIYSLKLNEKKLRELEQGPLRKVVPR